MQVVVAIHVWLRLIEAWGVGIEWTARRSLIVRV